MTSSLLRDERGIVLSFLLKLVLGLAVVALIVIESGSVILNRLQTDDVADIAASAAAEVVADGGSVTQARQAAQAVLAEKSPDARLGREIEISPQGDEVTLTVRKRADTLIIHSIPWLRDFTVARATVTGTPAGLP